MDYEYYYNIAKSRYYNACSEINSCENRINELKFQRGQKVNQINKLKTDIKDNHEALEGLEQINKSNTGLSQNLTNITNKTNQAATNYSSMIKAGDVPSKNLNDVYGNETANTKRILNNIFQSLKGRMNAVSTHITDLEKELISAETDLQNIESSIRTTESNLQEWRRSKGNASIDMEYYRHKMSEVV